MHFIQIDKLGQNRYRATHVTVADEDVTHYSNAGASSRGPLKNILEDIAALGLIRSEELNLVDIHGEDDFSLWQLQVPYTFINHRVQKGAFFEGSKSGLGTYLHTCQAAMGSPEQSTGHGQTDDEEHSHEPNLSM